MDNEKLENVDKKALKITTIKIGRATKERIDHLRIYNRETYDEIMQRILNILNICRLEPERARERLVAIDKERKRNLSNKNIIRRLGK